MKLYSYWRSTTSYRVRCALNLKNIKYEIIPIDLLTGVQKSDSYIKLNPSKGVPSLELNDGTIITQSHVIINYLDQIFPHPQLIPHEIHQRTKVLEASAIITHDIHPLNNLKVIKEIESRFDANNVQKKDWMLHWISEGFSALEHLLPEGYNFSFDDTPSIADICILAQVYNANRWGLELTQFPKINRINKACLEIKAFQDAHPDKQPDAKV